MSSETRFKTLRHIYETTLKAFDAWTDDYATTHAAALSYYTVFSVAPLLLIALSLGGFFFGADALEGHVVNALSGLLGPNGAKAVQEMLKASSLEKGGIVAGIVGGAVLLIGATTVFAQLQESLNVIWKVRPTPGKGFATLLRQRILSFAMIVVIAFLLLVSLVLTAVLAAVGEFANGRLPGGAAVWQILNFGASFALVALLFGAIFKILPDVKLGWRDVRFGAVITALLFTLGKLAIGLYLGKSAIATTYGAAGAAVIILVWAYYSSAILLFGAEYTRQHSLAIGRKIEFKEGAEWATEPAPSPGNPSEKSGPASLPVARSDENTRVQTPQNLG
jgi:membrane protein